MSTTRATGIALAFATAVVSGVSIYVNGRAVRHFGDATVYTTAKNAGRRRAARSRSPWPRARRGAPSAARRARDARQWLALLAVGVDRRQRAVRPLLRGARPRRGDAGVVHPEDARRLGRAARRAAPPRALRARRTPLAIVLLSPARRGSSGDAGHGRLRRRRGDDPRRDAALGRRGRLRQAPARGARRRARSPRREWASGRLLLLGWLAVSGRWASSPRLGAEQWRWVLLTGLLLTAYVATWYAALARAQAIDVTAVLVFGAVVTALLSGAVDGTAVERGRHGPRRRGRGAHRGRRARGGRRRRPRRVTAPPGRSSSRATRTRRTRSASAAPTSADAARVRRARASPTAASPSSRARSRARGPTSS